MCSDVHQGKVIAFLTILAATEALHRSCIVLRCRAALEQATASTQACNVQVICLEMPRWQVLLVRSFCSSAASALASLANMQATCAHWLHTPVCTRA